MTESLRNQSGSYRDRYLRFFEYLDFCLWVFWNGFTMLQHTVYRHLDNFSYVL